MKMIHKSPPVLILIMVSIIMAGCAGNRAPNVSGTASNAGALAALRHRDPQAVWDASSQVQADLDQDGIVDYALRGRRKDRVLVGIVKGPLGARSPTWVLDFAWGKKTQDSLCSQQAKIELEDLDESTLAGAKPATGPSGRQGKGVSLFDDRCDAFHIYWSPEDKKFDWWRL
jgi:hypothetical protein